LEKEEKAIILESLSSKMPAVYPYEGEIEASFPLVARESEGNWIKFFN